MTKIFNVKMILILILSFSSMTGLIGCIEIKTGGGYQGADILVEPPVQGGAEIFPLQISGLAFVKNPDLESDDLALPFTPNNLFAKVDVSKDVNGDKVYISTVELFLTPDQGTIAVTGGAERVSGLDDPNPNAPVSVELLGDCEASMTLDNQTIQELQDEIAKIKLSQTVKTLDHECAEEAPDYISSFLDRLPLELKNDNDVVKVSSFLCEMKAAGDKGYGLTEDADALKAKVEELASGLIAGCHAQVVAP